MFVQIAAAYVYCMFIIILKKKKTMLIDNKIVKTQVEKVTVVLIYWSN